MHSLLRITPPPNRIFGLDLLRAAAILFVLIGHSNPLLPPVVQPAVQNLVLDGVSIFFVLSGFLIGGILLRTFSAPAVGCRALLHFWVRRWARTLPAYFAVLLFLCGLYAFSKKDFSLPDAAPFFFFSQNLFTPSAPHYFFPEAWSISVEEWFYLLTPALLLGGRSLLRLSTAQAFGVVMLLLILVATGTRLYRCFEVPPAGIWEYTDRIFRKQVITRLDHLMWGVAAACWAGFYPKHWNQKRREKAILGLLLLLIAKFLLPRFFSPFSLYSLVFSSTVSALATVLLLPVLSNWQTATGAFATALTRLSLISYSAYLLNLSVVFLAVRRLPWSRWLPTPESAAWASWVIFWGLTLTLSTLLYKYFELPIMRLRDHRRVRRLLAPKG